MKEGEMYYDQIWSNTPLNIEGEVQATDVYLHPKGAICDGAHGEESQQDPSLWPSVVRAYFAQKFEGSETLEAQRGRLAGWETVARCRR